jgi:hypothetical protein
MITLDGLLALLAGTVDVPAQARYVPERAADIRHSLADVAAARHARGFADGLRRTVTSLIREPMPV